MLISCHLDTFVARVQRRPSKHMPRLIWMPTNKISQSTPGAHWPARRNAICVQLGTIPFSTDKQLANKHPLINGNSSQSEARTYYVLKLTRENAIIDVNKKRPSPNQASPDNAQSQKISAAKGRTAEAIVTTRPGFVGQSTRQEAYSVLIIGPMTDR